MYFYITSKVNNRHKVGITSDLTKRILNYCTLVPDISYLIACEPINAEIIEKGFKHRFNNFRPTIDGGLHRRRFPKSESYEVDFKWLFLLLIHALHADSEPLVYISNKNSFLNPGRFLLLRPPINNLSDSLLNKIHNWFVGIRLNMVPKIIKVKEK